MPGKETHRRHLVLMQSLGLCPNLGLNLPAAERQHALRAWTGIQDPLPLALWPLPSQFTFLFHPLQNEDASDSIYFTRWQEGWNEKLHIKNTVGSQWLLAFSLLLSHCLSCMLFIANTVMVWNGQIISHLPPKLGQSHCVKASVAQEVMFIFRVYFEPCPPPHTHSPSLAPLFFSFLRNTQDPHFTPKRVNALVFFLFL